MGGRLLAISTFIFVMAVAVFVLVMPHFSKSSGLLETSNFPESIGELRLVDFTSGKEAQEQISKLHGTDINVLQSYVAVYRNEEEQMVVWMTISPNAEEAMALYRAMDDLMPQNTVFTNYQENIWEGMRYYSVTGLGMNHFYYLQDRLVVWVGIVSPQMEGLFQETVRAFRGIDL